MSPKTQKASPANKNQTIETAQYTLTLPARIDFETAEEDGLSHATFRLDGEEVGGVAFHSFPNAGSAKADFKKIPSDLFDRIFLAIGVEEFFDETVGHMGGSSSHADFQISLDSIESREKPFHETHYFFICSDTLLCDLYFDHSKVFGEEITLAASSFRLDATA